MRTLIILLLSVNTGWSQPRYDQILDRLSYNHVLLKEEMGAGWYFESFKSDSLEHGRQLALYREGVSAFFNADVQIIKYLLDFESDTLLFCSWIRTANPYLSTLRPNDLLTIADGALILIHNYLCGDDSTSRISPDLPPISFSELQTFYSNNKTRSRKNIRIEYRRHLNRLE